MGDYGKGYDVGQNAPFRRFLLRILKTGRGVAMITHTKVEINKWTAGEKARKECSLPGGIRKICESQADIIMHGELGKKQPGLRLRDRILVCEGDMDTLAGNRTNAMLPERYIVSPDNPWKQFTRFFINPESTAKAEALFNKRMKRK